MINKTESEERAFLEHVKGKLRDVLVKIDNKVQEYAREIREQKEYLWENKSGMDHVEKISVRQSVDQSVLTGEAVVDKKKRVQKLLQTPYFGRFDFVKEGETMQSPVYVGVHGFYDEQDGDFRIYDWRAPISTMFYDYEKGLAEFTSPEGRMIGEIVLKRQYRIRGGQMEFMLESDVSIHDDVLQKELSCAADDKMKNIVATIQRDQNAIIRNEDSQVLIIQGVAGSGKTSIALHRIAFLLYRFKDSIASKDLLIISPNKVFADYISNVLPELGEETIPEIGIEQLANNLLEREFKFQTFFEQVAHLLEKKDKAFERRIQAKASVEFLGKLENYVAHINESYFMATDLYVNGRLVPEWFLKERFEGGKNIPIMRRLNKIAKDVETNIGIYYQYDITAEERSYIKESIKKMFQCPTLRSLYKDFYSWLGKPELCKFIQSSILEYSDVFPLIYLKMHWDGVGAFDEVKHLLIDEMQDYTPVQYKVISRLFSCKKTILGDANQSVNPLSASTAKEIEKVFEGSDCVKLCKSYRSTFEITRFAQSISPNHELEVIERHGSDPDVLKFQSIKEQSREISRIVESFGESDYHSLGIICKTQKQAEELYQYLKEQGLKIYLLTSQSESFIQGVVVCTAHMAKGLEFDHVVVPDVTDQNYYTDIDKSMLYVACTRAMHQLTITYVKTLTSFIKQN